MYMAQVTPMRDIQHGGSVKAQFDLCRAQKDYAVCIVEVFDALASNEATAQQQYGDAIDILEKPTSDVLVLPHRILYYAQAEFQKGFREIRSDEHDHEQKIRLMLMQLTGKTRLVLSGKFVDRSDKQRF